VRDFLRIIDLIPLHSVSAQPHSKVVSDKKQRVGDRAARTVVVKGEALTLLLF
jgi:uncharacterized RDD family membrane protein YckC